MSSLELKLKSISDGLRSTLVELHDGPILARMDYERKDDHVIVFDTYRFITIPIEEGAQQGFMEDCAILSSHERKCTLYRGSVGSEDVTWYARGTFPLMEELCQDLNEPLVHEINQSKARDRKIWSDKLTKFRPRDFHLDEKMLDGKTVRIFVNKLENEVVKLLEVNTCLYISLTKFKQKYEALKLKTKQDVEHEFDGPSINPFDISNLDEMYDTDDSDDSDIQIIPSSDPIKTEQMDDDVEEQCTDATATDSKLRSSRTMLPFKMMSNAEGKLMSGHASSFEFYDEQQDDRNIIIRRFIPKMKNLFEVVRLMALVHFNGIDFDVMAFPIPPSWPKTTDSDIAMMDKQERKQNHLNFHCCVYFWQALQALLPFHTQTLPAMSAISLLIEKIPKQAEIMSEVLNLPDLDVPEIICDAYKCPGHVILKGGQGSAKLEKDSNPFVCVMSEVLRQNGAPADDSEESSDHPEESDLPYDDDDDDNSSLDSDGGNHMRFDTSRRNELIGDEIKEIEERVERARQMKYNESMD